MTNSRLWVLGASDPEMSAIESLLRECGERVIIATHDWQRVSPSSAYRADAIHVEDGSQVTVYLVECRPTMLDDARGGEPGTARKVIVDHHRPGDPGYGARHAQFMRGSSLGQVIAELARLDALPSNWRRCGMSADPGSSPGFAGDIYYYDSSYSWIVVDCRRAARSIPYDLVLTAAADHCLVAAYAGRCPGVSPDELLCWRAGSRAELQGREIEEVMSDIAAAKEDLEGACRITLGSATACGNCAWCGHHMQSMAGEGCDHCECPRVADVRGVYVPELVDAGARYGIAYVADGRPMADGRRKTVCSGPAEAIAAFLGCWAPANGLVDCYGDPARGFAGGYDRRV